MDSDSLEYADAETYLETIEYGGQILNDTLADLTAFAN